MIYFLNGCLVEIFETRIENDEAKRTAPKRAANNRQADALHGRFHLDLTAWSCQIGQLFSFNTPIDPGVSQNSRRFWIVVRKMFNNELDKSGRQASNRR
jgi:hypothetical protein